MAFINQVDDKKTFGIPGKRVQIHKPFHLGKTEVTYEQFDYYVWDQKRAGHVDENEVRFPMMAKGGRGNLPVVNVDWHEATAYATWLGNRFTQVTGTQQSCRLPTEAEWEYAARANSKTVYPWGDEVRRGSDGKVMANCEGCGSQWDSKQSAPVGSFAENGFGLYDMSGNVWEWTCSSWNGPEQHCADTKDLQIRVLRGGSWNSQPIGLRSSARTSGDPLTRFNLFGFRVLCSSPIE